MTCLPCINRDDSSSVAMQVAQLSCLHYNNCQYLAHELVTLPFIVRPPMGTLLGPKWQFLEEAGDLKKAGQAQLDFQVILVSRLSILNITNMKKSVDK